MPLFFIFISLLCSFFVLFIHNMHIYKVSFHAFYLFSSSFDGGVVLLLKKWKMGLFSREVPIEVWCWRDMLFAEREGKGISKRVIRVCGVWCWRSCDHTKGTQLHLGCVSCRGQVLQIRVTKFFLRINIILVFWITHHSSFILGYC